MIVSGNTCSIKNADNQPGDDPIIIETTVSRKGAVVFLSVSQWGLGFVTRGFIDAIIKFEPLQRLPATPILLNHAK